MNKIHVKIDRIEITLNGIPQSIVRKSAEGLDAELLAEFAKQGQNMNLGNAMKNVDKINSSISIPAEMTSQDLKRMIAMSVVKSFLYQQNRTQGRGVK